MKKVKQKSVLNWLLENGRYEDAEKFLQSDEAKEKYYNEMVWSLYKRGKNISIGGINMSSERKN